MSMFKINGVPMTAPTGCSWKLSDLSSEDSGRSTRDGSMSKDIIAQKRTLSLTWSMLSWEEASKLANFCKNKGAVITLTYPDIMAGTYTTIRCYTGDMTAEYKIWNDGMQYVTNVVCSFIEM